MKKALLIALITFGFSIQSYSFYTLTDLTSLIEKSDIIIYGEIYQIGTLNIKILVHEQLKGGNVTDTLQFRKFINWSCANRYAKYEIGQEAIFFLRIHDDNRIYGMGAGNEGEILVKDSITYFQEYERASTEGQVVEFLNPYAKYILFDVQLVIDGLRTYLNNIDIINREYEISPPGTVRIFNYEVMNISQNDFYQYALKQKRLKLL